ncbi:MAG TPA: phage holin family protein [Polyangia bacterium]|nr:phage holin family protein [Polyangia bacterium]
MQPSTPESLTNRDLLKELFSDVSLLAQRQVKLAELEARRQLKREVRVIEWLGTGGALAFAGTILWLVAAALGLGAALAGAYWAGALIVGAVLLAAAAIAGVIGWSRRVKQPLRRSRRELEKEVTWVRHQVTT